MKGELAATVDAHRIRRPRRKLLRPELAKEQTAIGSGPSSGGASVRFFLSKSESNGVPGLDREFDSEPEAIVESLKTGKSYFVISEWKGLADLSKKIPLIRKEAIGNKKQILISGGSALHRSS